MATIWAHLSEPPPRASVEADVPVTLDGVIERAMAKDPDDRFQTAAEMAEAARAALGGVKPERPPKRRRTTVHTASTPRPPVGRTRGRSRGLLIGGGIAVIALAGMLAVTLGGSDGQDAGTPAAAERFKVSSIPLKSISFAAATDPVNSSVWVTGPDRGLLTRVDTGASAPVEPPLPVGEDPFGVTVTATHVWVAIHGEGEVIRFPASRRIGRPRRARIGGTPGWISVTSRTAWVADDTGFVKRVDPDTMRVQGKPIPVGKGVRVILADLAGAWVTNYLRGTLTRIDPEGQIKDKPIQVGKGAAGLTLAAGYVWVTNQDDGTVRRIDARTGKVVGRPIAVGRGPTGVAAGAGYIWVASSAEDSVSRIDPRTARTVGKPIRVGRSPLWVAVGDDAVWVTTTGARAISVIHLNPTAKER